MRTIKLIAVAGALALTGVACGGTDDGGALTPPGDGPGTIHEVIGTADTNQWDPKTLTVKVGDTVDWSWSGAIGGHNVVSVDGDFNSGDPIEDGEFSNTFETAGTFNYYCTIHGTPDDQELMFGTVTVEA